MAQTRRKRRTKHRGNAAGIVEARGRTGRKPTAEELKDKRRERARQARRNRFDRPPSWRSAANRALVAVVIFILFVSLALQQPL